MIWRVFCGCFLGLLFFFSAEFSLWCERFHFGHARFSLHLLHLSDAPLGWKLEPLLAGALQRAAVVYTQMFFEVSQPLVSFASPFLTAFGLGMSILTDSPRPLFLALFLVLSLAEGGLALLAFLARRICSHFFEALFSLILLFQGRHYSLLRARQEPLASSPDTILLGLLVFAAILMLFPALATYAGLMSLLALPTTVAHRILF